MAVFQKPKGQWTRDGRSWYFRCYYKDYRGNIKSKGSRLFLTKKEAKDEEAIFLLKRKERCNIRFGLVAKDYIDHISKTRKESTAYSYNDDYKRHIQPYFDDLYLDSINMPICREWKSGLEKKGYSLKYLNGFYNVLKGIFDYAIKNYGLENNPIATLGRFEHRQDQVIKDEEKLRYITYEQYQKFISEVDNSLYKSLFTTLYFTGMRKGEIQALNWNDIDFNNNMIIVNKTLSIKTNEKNGYKITKTKNYKNRKVEMNKVLKEQLLSYKKELKAYKDFSENWFVFGNSRFLPQTSIDRYKDFYFKTANIPAITIHEFRHSHVSLLINQYILKCNEKNMEIDSGAFFVMVANRLGDTVDTMQKVYLHLFPQIQKPIVNLLDNL